MTALVNSICQSQLLRSPVEIGVIFDIFSSNLSLQDDPQAILAQAAPIARENELKGLEYKQFQEKGEKIRKFVADLLTECEQLEKPAVPARTRQFFQPGSFFQKKQMFEKCLTECLNSRQPILMQVNNIAQVIVNYYTSLQSQEDSLHYRKNIENFMQEYGIHTIPAINGDMLCEAVTSHEMKKRKIPSLTT